MEAGLRKPDTSVTPGPAAGGEGDPCTPGAIAEGAAAHLVGMERALVDQSIAFAKSNGYAPYTTTIRGAWVEAVRSVTEALGAYLTGDRAGPSGPQAGITYRDDPRFAHMRAIARRHRSLGITLELYLGLFKHFRRVYLDALSSMPAESARRTRLLERVQDFFDETELSVTADWTASGDDDRLRELQARTRALTLAKDRYVAIFESLRHPAFLLDRARGLVHANQAAVELFLGEGEVGDSLYRHGRDAPTARLTADIDALLRCPADPETAIALDTPSGQRWFDRRLRPLHDAVENISLGYLLQLYDVTSYHDATDAARRAERQMSRFLATMSHEIRTPLHSVLGAAELLRVSDSDSHESYLDVIQGAGHALLKTLNNVLDYSKLENGPPVPRPVDTELGPALETFCAMASVGPQASGSRLTLDVSTAVRPLVRIDWAMTRQVLTNLVSNALRHDDGIGVYLRVETGHAGEHRVLRFEVTDHGPGFSPEAARAFHDPFEATRARHTPQGGAGLGLAISRYLAAAMGGRIGFENTGTGARVWFEVPVVEEAVGAAATEPARQRALAEAPAGASCGGRCLLVDDDRVGSIISAHQLERIGFDVDHVATLGAARRAIGRVHYDAVVVDYLLPDGTGPELLTALRCEAPTVPRVIALTANVEALTASGGPCHGFHEVLAKPTDAASLAHALRRRAAAGKVPPSAPVSNGLEGLSAATVADMTSAFLVQWSAFRARLALLRRGGPLGDLGACAHRLAGTTAQLGLCDLAGPLRELERRCDSGGDDLRDVIERLDRPAEETASWHHLPHA